MIEINKTVELTIQGNTTPIIGKIIDIEQIEDRLFAKIQLENGEFQTVRASAILSWKNLAIAA